MMGMTSLQVLCYQCRTLFVEKKALLVTGRPNRDLIARLFLEFQVIFVWEEFSLLKH